MLITHTGCQFPCNQAPVVSVQPDDVWYGGVDPEVAGVSPVSTSWWSPCRDHRLPRVRRATSLTGTRLVGQEPGASPGRFRHCDARPESRAPAHPDTGHGTSTYEGREPPGRTMKIALFSTSDTDLLSARASGADYVWANPARPAHEGMAAFSRAATSWSGGSSARRRTCARGSSGSARLAADGDARW